MLTNKTDNKTREFRNRLIELCGTNQPAELAQKMDISYQAARNYLNGRLPETNVLLMIAEKTKCSIHWLLTGEGKKFISEQDNLNTLIISDQMKAFVREQCLEVFSELFAVSDEPAQIEINNVEQKVVKIASGKIRLEKTGKKSSVLPENQS
ncbi:MAG: helix-turn-helix domain containing protein [Pyrinomonadaceae bacterium]|nr:helix-turn-helix domain containing protein [Pyrinomonadaceae bacterium]